MSKFADMPRNKFADLEPEAPKRMKDFTPYTLAWAIQFYIDDMDEIGKPVGSSQKYAMRKLQRSAIGGKFVEKLQEDDYLEHAKARKKAGVVPATTTHDLSNIRVVLKHVRAARKDCKAGFKSALKELEVALPLLQKLNLTGKSAPRRRRPTDDEIARLLAYFEKPSGHGKARVIRMPDVIAFALVSTRRIGEICRITHGDIDYEKRTYWVRDLKHPTKKKGNDKEFALFDELAEIIRRQPRQSDSPHERVFPFNSKSCSQAYTNAKKRLGIEGLHFHDNRREAITRWLKRLGQPSKVRQISGHETSVILERVYDVPRPEDLHAELQRSAP